MYQFTTKCMSLSQVHLGVIRSYGHLQNACFRRCTTGSQSRMHIYKHDLSPYIIILSPSPLSYAAPSPCRLSPTCVHSLFTPFSSLSHPYLTHTLSPFYFHSSCISLSLLHLILSCPVIFSVSLHFSFASPY